MDMQLHNSIVRRSTVPMTTAKGKSAQGATFQEALEGQQQVSNKKDTVSLSGGSIADRLEKLKKISENMDYADMSKEEIYRSIGDRYEEVFPCWRAMIYYDNDNYDRILKSYAAELDSTIGNQDYSKEFFQKAFGYEGMSKKEMLAAITKEYPGSDPISRIVAIDRMGKVGIMPGIEAMKLTDNIWRNVEKKACAAKGLDWNRDKCFQNPLRKQWAYALAQTMSLSWSTIMEEFSKSDTLNEEQRREYTKDLEEALDQLLKDEKRR